MNPTPVDIELKQAAGELLITWSDQHVSRFSLRYLRGWCPCAKCQGHFSDAKKFVASTNPRLSDVVPVGGYGAAFHWGDGHTTGIYAFDYLREIEAAPPGDGPTNAELLGG